MLSALTAHATMLTINSAARASFSPCSRASTRQVGKLTATLRAARSRSGCSSSSICLSVNGRTSRRKTQIVPIAAPRRRSGLASIVRWPKRRCSSRPSGYSACGSAARSWRWMVRPATTDRPLTEPRFSGNPSWMSIPVAQVPCAATRLRRPSSQRRITTSSASHSRAALSATASSTGWRSVGKS
jgi:hypothetical protein